MANNPAGYTTRPFFIRRLSLFSLMLPLQRREEDERASERKIPDGKREKPFDLSAVLSQAYVYVLPDSRERLGSAEHLFTWKFKQIFFNLSNAF